MDFHLQEARRMVKVRHTQLGELHHRKDFHQGQVRRKDCLLEHHKALVHHKDLLLEHHRVQGPHIQLEGHHRGSRPEGDSQGLERRMRCGPLPDWGPWR